MEIRKNKKVVEVEETIYIATDGKEFINIRECEIYERDIILNKFIAEAEKLRIKELDEQVPINCTDMNENNSFRWYKVNNELDLEKLNKAYRADFEKPSTYPETYCVETMGSESYQDDSYEYTLSNMISVTKGFWKKLGFELDFNKQ